MEEEKKKKPTGRQNWNLSPERDMQGPQKLQVLL